jgi:hypothetical protein
VIRFKTPVGETLHLQDIIRGDVKFETSLLDDKVPFKSDGMPTYHLANIVDDHLMENMLYVEKNGYRLCRYTFYYTELLVGMHLNLPPAIDFKTSWKRKTI